MNKHKRLLFSIALFVMALTIFVCRDSGDVYASTTYQVTFNYNPPVVADYLPANILSTLRMYTIEVAEGDCAVETTKPREELNSYYTYIWTVGGEVVDISTYPITKNTTFVAKYTPVEYTIHYSYSAQEAIEIKNIVYEINYTVETPRIDFYRPVRDNYTFVDWYSSSSLSDDYLKLYKADYDIGDLYLYAKWIANEYTINYNTDAENLDNPATYTIEDGDIILEEPTKAGYTFVGWYLDENFTTPCTKIASGTTGNLNLYPKWNPNTLNVTYILPDGTTEIVSVEYGKTASMPKTLSSSIFDIVQTDVSRDNITEDVTIRIKTTNIWYVYLIALILIVATSAILVIKTKRKNSSLNKMRVKYQSSLRVVNKRKSK